jgi:hypothetical protein
MVPICLLVEAIAVEICSRYIVNKWMQLAHADSARPKVASRSVKRKKAA